MKVVIHTLTQFLRYRSKTLPNDLYCCQAKGLLSVVLARWTSKQAHCVSTN